MSILCISKNENIDKETLWSSIRERALNLRLNIDELIVVMKNKPEYDTFKEEWERCALDCMVFQYESELKLGNLGSIESVLAESDKIHTLDFDSILVNIVIDDQYPERIKSAVLTKVLERNLGDSSIPAVKISRWIRLLLKYSSGVEIEDNSLKIVHQIYTRLCSQEVSALIFKFETDTNYRLIGRKQITCT